MKKETMIDINKMAATNSKKATRIPNKKKKMNIKLLATVLIVAAVAATGTMAICACHQNLANEANKAAITTTVNKISRSANKKSAPTRQSATAKPQPTVKQKETQKPTQKPTQAPTQKPTTAPTQAPTQVSTQAPVIQVQSVNV